MNVAKRSILLGLAFIGIIASARADVIKGYVTDNANYPIPNAEVRVVPFQTTGTKTQRILHTNAQGFFSAHITPMKAMDDVTIYAVAPGYAEGSLWLPSDPKDNTNDIQLQKAELVSGVVVDPLGKPAAGVKVQLQGFTVKGTSYPHFTAMQWLFYSPWANRYNTVTDKTGHWQFKAVPQGSHAHMIIHDPRFVSQEFDVYRGKQYLLHARPSATLTGSVVDKTGAPVANVEVTARNIVKVINKEEFETTSTTAADGSYQLTGLPTGSYDISVYAGNLPVVAAIIRDQPAHEGTSKKLRNFVLMPGGIITGRVLNEKTGEPVADAYAVTCAFNNSAYTRETDYKETSANGRYTLRVPPGIHYVGILSMGGEYIPKKDDYVPITVQEGQTVTQNFELNPGITVNGVAVDKQGKPVAGVQIIVNQLSTANSSEVPTTDANGRWKVAALVPGSVVISVQNPWYISGSSPITLPHKGEVRIIVNNINDLPPVGRVVDIHHKPLKGIIMQLTYEAEHGRSGTGKSANAVSDANGYLHVQPVQFDPPFKLTSANVDNISNSDYIFVSGGKWNAKTSTFSDIVLDDLDNVVHGRVLNKQGKPAPGVRVEAAGYDNAVTKTDKAGNFALNGLPHQNVTLLAIGKQTVSKLTIPSVSWAILHLAPLPANHFPTRAQVFDKLEKLYRTSDKNDFMRSAYLNEMIECDAPRGLKVFSDVNRKLSFEQIHNTVDTLSTTNPSLALQWAGQHLATVTKDDDRIVMLCQLTKLAVGHDDDLAQKYFSEAEILAQKTPAPVQKKYGSNTSVESPMDPFLYNHIYLAGAAAKMHPEKTNEWLVQMLDYLKDKDLKPPSYFDYLSGKLAAELGTVAPQQAALLIQNSSASSAATELYFATSAAARAGKTDLALHWLDQLRTLYQSDKTSPSQRKPSYGNSAFAVATYAVIKLIGPKNPAKALDLARMIIDKQDAARCLRLAATYQSKPIALAVLSELFEVSPPSNYGYSPRLAAMIYNIDPTKGKVLFDQLLKKSQQQEEIFSTDRNYPVSDRGWAYYMARFKPLACWEILQNAHAESKQPQLQNGYYDLKHPQTILAMSALNFGEAMRWARKLTPQTLNPNVSDNTQFSLLQIALAPPKARSTLDLYNPGASDS